MTITGNTRLAAVLGWPVAHSRSPQIMNAAFAATGYDAVMVPMAVPPGALAATLAALRATGALGASVTMPHKADAFRLADELTDAARATLAVNCLQLERERWIGHNTDAPGYLDALTAAGFAAAGAHTVVLGAGGAARAVAFAMRAGSVEVIARRPDEITWTQARPWTASALREAFARADLVVDCTSIGHGSSSEAELITALPLAALRPHAWVSSLVYHRTPLLLVHARERGHATLDGGGMLVHQAARAFQIWTALPPPLDVMARAFAGT